MFAYANRVPTHYHRRSSAFLAASLAIVAALTGLPALADGESLAETGGYVPVDAPALAFKNITLADLGTTYLPSVKKGGSWAGGEAEVPLILRTEESSGGVLTSVSYQAQWVDGTMVKCATIKFTNGEGGVFAQTVAAKYTEDSLRSNYLTDFSGREADKAASASANGYGFCGLRLRTAVSSTFKSININFNYSQATKVWTADPVGIAAYSVSGRLWNQMNGSNGNTLPCVTIIGTDNSEEFYASSSSKVIINDTNGAWDTGPHSAPSDIRYGYIDTNGHPTPKVTVRDIPFDHYRVVFYGSGDTSDAKFGYVTVNGVNYTSTNTEKAESGDFQTVIGTDSWGKTQVVDTPVNGVSCLVTPVTSAKTLTVVGHNISGTERGCIAAIQIIRADEAPTNEYSLELAGNVTWSSLTDFSGSADKVIYINNNHGDATVTFDTAVQASLLVVTGSGSTSLKFTNAAYNQIAGINALGVTGEIGIDDVVQAGTFAQPASGTVRYNGTATLSSFPYNGSDSEFGLVIDQPITLADTNELKLVGNKALVAFDENCTASFTKFVIGNDGGANQTIEQRGGSIVVSGETLNANQSSLLFGHYSSAVVTLRSLGGTFTGNAVVRFGWDGQINWTIGDGESADGTSLVTVPGLQSGNGRSGNAVLTLKKGGTLNLGGYGFQSNSSSSIYNFAGGILNFVADSQITNPGGIALAADTTTTLNTGASTVTNNAVISGTGNLAKIGAGTLMFTSSSLATGTLTVDAGTVKLSDGVTWSGTINVGANGTLDIIDADVSETETVYIPVGGTLTLAEGAAVKLNGTAINSDIWELSGGTFINKTLKTALTTATGDFAFSTATWASALAPGEAAEIDWAGSLSEVRVHANNAAPATATVDVTAAAVSTFAVDGSGDMTFVADNGGITASAYDFSGATGRVEYDLSTGSAPITSGSNTLLLGGGSGAPTVAAGQTLTLGPWGTTDDSGLTNTYSTILRPATGSTLVFSPGEGRVQKTAGFGDTDTSTTIAVTNGTLVVNLGGEGTSKFFGRNSVRIDNGGVVSLESQDALGWSNADGLTINKGGTLVVKVRDSLKRTVAFNGGTIELYGANSSRALDLYGNTINVNDDSSMEQMESQSVVYLRNNLTTVNVADGKTLSINANIYAEGGNSGNKLLFQAASGASSQNGVVVLNGYSGDAKQYFNNETTVGTSGRAVICELNCEHQNGIYTVNAASRLRGTGSITGNGGVTLAAANSKLCGALTVNNLTAASGGTYGDQWNAVSAKVATTYFAAGTQTIENGSFTIGAGCAVTNAAGTANTTDATFSIAANANLVLGKSVTVGALTVADGGSITLAGARNSAAQLTVAGTLTQSGKINIVLDFGDRNPPPSAKFPLLAAAGVNLANVTLRDKGDVSKWRITYENGVVYGSTDSGFAIRLR